MRIKLPSINRNADRENALARARLSAAFLDIAVRKGGLAVSERNKNQSKRRTQRLTDIGLFERKPSQRTKKARYIPGTLGASVVSESIKAEYGVILSRRERKRLTKLWREPFIRFYIGEAAKG